MYTNTLITGLVAALPLISALPADAASKLGRRDAIAKRQTQTCAGTQTFPWFINPQTQTDCLAPQIGRAHV